MAKLKSLSKDITTRPDSEFLNVVPEGGKVFVLHSVTILNGLFQEAEVKIAKVLDNSDEGIIRLDLSLSDGESLPVSYKKSDFGKLVFANPTNALSASLTLPTSLLPVYSRSAEGDGIEKEIVLSVGYNSDELTYIIKTCHESNLDVVTELILSNKNIENLDAYLKSYRLEDLGKKFFISEQQLKKSRKLDTSIEKA